VVLASASANLTTDTQALARIDMPLGGGTVQSIVAVRGPHSARVPVELRGSKIWPKVKIRAGQRIAIEVVIKRPSWIGWLAGKTQRLRLTFVAPSSVLRQSYVTLPSGAPLTVRFDHPVTAISYGPTSGQLTGHKLDTPTTDVRLQRAAEAGSIWVAGVARSWETAKAQPISWFPAGAATSAVASPVPGTVIRPQTPITLTFSKPVDQALRRSVPPVSPVTAGRWHQVSSHAIVFRPEGYGYGLGATVKIGLPAGVRLVGGRVSGSAEDATWTVPAGSTTRLQQLLAILGYLPLRFRYAAGHPAPNAAAEEAAAIHPPAGNFTWRYGNVPSALHSMWAPGSAGTMTRGAVMSYENDHGMLADGVAGPQVWKSMISAALADHGTGFGYSFVSVSLSGQHLSVWHNGHTVAETAVNTGIASRPTAAGTFPVYEHIRVGTMSGTNPDGSHYNDPGIQFISYFNGGDALHAFTRAQYGFPQSLGCVEMALGPAGQVWPYTPVGTLVNVA
jgi:hypothetical protein